jgi:hypothetical protein
MMLWLVVAVALAAVCGAILGSDRVVKRVGVGTTLALGAVIVSAIKFYVERAYAPRLLLLELDPQPSVVPWGDYAILGSASVLAVATAAVAFGKIRGVSARTITSVPWMLLLTLFAWLLLFASKMEPKMSRDHSAVVATT